MLKLNSLKAHYLPCSCGVDTCSFLASISADLLRKLSPSTASLFLQTKLYLFKLLFEFISIYISACPSSYILLSCYLSISIYSSSYLSISIYWSLSIFLYPYICIFVSFSIHQAIYVSLTFVLYLSLSLSIYIYISICISRSASINLSSTIDLCLSISIHRSLFIILYPSVSIYPSLHLSNSLSFGLYVSIYRSISFFLFYQYRFLSFSMSNYLHTSSSLSFSPLLIQSHQLFKSLFCLYLIQINIC